MQITIRSNFPLGRLVATKNALSQLRPWDMHKALERHACGDWGEVCAQDKAINDESLKGGGARLLSVYRDKRGTTFWIITEWDRSLTTILLPEDY